MNDEYDFSSAERGRFCRPGAGLVPRVRLETDVLAALFSLARTRDVSLDDLVNELLRKALEAPGTP